MSDIKFYEMKSLLNGNEIISYGYGFDEADAIEELIEELDDGSDSHLPFEEICSTSEDEVLTALYNKILEKVKNKKDINIKTDINPKQFHWLKRYFSYEECISLGYFNHEECDSLKINENIIIYSFKSK